jgi:hypothetical protein
MRFIRTRGTDAAADALAIASSSWNVDASCRSAVVATTPPPNSPRSALPFDAEESNLVRFSARICSTIESVSIML